MERHYETICIIKSDIGEAAVQEIVKKATASLEKGDAEVCKVDEWGRRRLAYPIEKKHEGFYVLFDYTSTPGVNKELERSFRLNEDVMRYQTVRIEVKAAAKAASEEDAAAKAASAQGATGPDEAVSDDKGGEDE
jgi:small subunit ribosomal protein S6